MKHNQEMGITGEDIAATYLKKRGYRIEARRYRKRRGEADIVAWNKKTLVFVEVKTRTSDKFGMPAEAVTPAKQKALTYAAMLYIQEHGLEDVAARFDVVEVLLPSGKVHHIINAFEAVG